MKSFKKGALARKAARDNDSSGGDPLIALQSEETRLQQRLLQLPSEFEASEQRREQANVETLRLLQQSISDIELEDRKLVATIDHHRRVISSSQRSVTSVEGDIEAIQRRISQLKKEIGEEPSDADSSNKQQAATPDSSAGNSPVQTNTGSKSPVEYEKLVRSVEKAESQVVALRSTHVDTRNALKELTDAVEHGRLSYDKEIMQLRDMQQLSHQFVAMQTSSHHREAEDTVRTHAQLSAEVSRQEDQIRALQSEKKLMLKHLLDGAKQRHNTLKELRSRFLPLNGNETFSSLFKENQKERENLISVYFTMDAEMEALQTFIQVLQKRCERTAERIHTMSFDLELNQVQHQQHIAGRY